MNTLKGFLKIASDKLLLCKPVNMADKCIGLIVAPSSLRRKLFNHYLSGSSGGRMGTYKTFFRMLMRFFWLHMREDIKQWVANCVHCVSYNVWRSTKREMRFSWPMIVPFWIIHVNMWSPGATLDTEDNKSYLMNSMCDITQFVLSLSTELIESAVLAKLFMTDAIMTFGM